MLSYSFKKFFLFLNSDARSLKNIRIFYFALFFLITVLSFLLSLRYLSRYPDTTLFNVRPVFGPYIKNLVQEGSYYLKYDGIIYYARRLPLIPYFMAAIAYVHNSIVFGFFIKNLLVCFLTAYSFKILLSNTKTKTYVVIIAIIGIFFIPYNLNILLDIDHEEAYAWALLLMFFSLLSYSIRYKEKLFNIVIMSILIACLLLLKSTYIYLGIFLSFYLFLTLKSRIHKIIPLSFTLSVILLWGMFNYNSSGYFALLNRMSSWNGENLYKANNEYALKYYPKYHPDAYRESIIAKHLSNHNFSNEWERNQFFEDKAKSFILSHPLEVLHLAWIKTTVFFLDIREINVIPGVVERFGNKSLLEKAMFYVSMLINRALLFLALILSIHYSFFAGKIHELKWRKKISLAYLSIVIIYAFPCIIGYAMYRHVVPLIPLTIIFLIWVLSGKNQNNLHNLNREAL
jgi:hypothetical protein